MVITEYNQNRYWSLLWSWMLPIITEVLKFPLMLLADLTRLLPVFHRFQADLSLAPQKYPWLSPVIPINKRGPQFLTLIPINGRDIPQTWIKGLVSLLEGLLHIKQLVLGELLTQLHSWPTNSKDWGPWVRKSKKCQRHRKKITLRMKILASKSYQINFPKMMRRTRSTSKIRRWRVFLQEEVENHLRRTIMMMMKRRKIQKIFYRMITWYRRPLQVHLILPSKSRVRFKTMTPLEWVKPRLWFQISWRLTLNSS